MKYFRLYQRWYEESFDRYSSTEDKSFWILNLLRSPWFAVCFLVLLSITVSLLNDSWLFTGAGWYDGWIYAGYGYTFDDQEFGGYLKNGYYKLGRIPWVYLQYLVRQSFSPLTSSYILQYSCLWLGTFSVFFAVRRLLGHIPAFLAAVFLCVYNPFLGSGGADYHNTLVGPLYALSFLILTIAAQKEKRALGWLVLFGCIFGMIVHTMILYINFAPALLFHFYTVRKIFCKDTISFRNFIFTTLSGFVLATLICGLISVAYGYKFLFFLPQLGLTKTFLYGEWVTSPWWRSWSSGWVSNAYWLAPLATMMIFALGALLFIRKNRQQGPTALIAHTLNLQFLFIGFVWLFWQLLKKDTLNTAYFTYPLIIPFAMSMAASFSLYLSNQVRNLFLPLILGIFAIIAMKFENTLLALNLFQFSPFVLMFLLFAIVLSFLFFYKRGSVFAVTFLAIACVYPAYYQRSSFSIRDSYLAIADASQWIYNTYGKRGIPDRAKNVLMWFDESAPQDPSSPLSALAYSLTNTTFDYLHSPFPMPSIQNLKSEELKAKLSQQQTKVVALITENESDVKAMQKRLEEVGFSLDFVEFREFRVNQIRLPIYILRGK